MPESPYLISTRTAYDAIAPDYADRFRAEYTHKPLDRAMLAAFAELVLADGGGPVLDVGCGPGHVTARLHGLGLDVAGVDLSAGMLALARRSYPELRFDEGTMTALDLADGTLAGLVAFYSIIHIPAEELAGVFAEFARVLAPGGHLLLAFQVGEEPLRFSEPFGHPVPLEFRRLVPAHVTALLDQAGLPVQATLVREPDATETTQQAHLLARKPPPPPPPS